MTETTPPQAQVHLSLLVASGIPELVWVGVPGTQGDTGTGTQGCGVSTPLAADVAEATAGLASDEHMPKGMMLIIGIVCTMVAAGTIGVGVPGRGVATKVDGAAPKVHDNTVPVVNAVPI